MTLLGWTLPGWVGLLHVGLELLLVAWMWNPWLGGPRRLAYAVLFLGYAAINLVGILRGEAHCGCFGDVVVPIWLTMGMGAVIGAWWIIVREPVASVRMSWISALLSIVLPVAATLIPARVVDASTGQHAERSSSLTGFDAADLASLVPLSRGRWTVILYQDTCPHCQRDLGRWVDCTDRSPKGIGGHPWVFVGIGEVHGGELLDEATPSPSIPRYRILRSSVAPLPCALIVESGIIVRRVDSPP